MEERGVDGRLTLNSDENLLPCARECRDRQEACLVGRRGGGARGRGGRARGARAAEPRSRGGASLVGSAERRAAARARPARAPARRRGRPSPRSPPTSRRDGADRPRRRCGAPALCSAPGICACRSPERSCAIARARWTPRSACLRALVADDDRAPVPALHLGLALLWSGQRAEATAELQETRSLDPGRRSTGGPPTTSCTRRIAGRLSALGALPLRARLASPLARAGSGRPALRGCPTRLRLRAAVQLAYASATRGGEGAGARREQHRR